MSLGELQLLQPEAGYKPGAKYLTEKWLLVKFVHGGFIESVVGQIGRGHSFDWMTTLAEFPVQGKYFIVSNNMTPGNNAGYTIGDSSHHSYKCWRYNPGSLTLFFCTIENMGGGGLKFGETEAKLKDDLVLYNVRLTRKGFEPLQGNATDSTGRVLIKSWIKPFEERPVYWNTL